MTEQQIFQNGQVELSSIPTADHIDFSPLQPDYLKLITISILITTAVLTIASFLVLFFQDIPSWIAFAGGGFWILIGVLQLFFATKGFRFKGFAIRQRDVAYKKGWLYKRQTIVPFSRIQHVDTKQGVLERIYDLGKLNVYTAGGQGSDLTIPGLAFDEAQRMKSFILGIMESDEEE